MHRSSRRIASFRGSRNSRRRIVGDERSCVECPKGVVDRSCYSGKPLGVEMRDKREFSYVVDAQDRIVSANGDWFAFARENGAAALDKGGVIGHSLWDFICDAETKILYSLFLKSVRSGGTAKHLPYRCDSADVRRYMEMTIATAEAGCVEFRSS